MTIITKGNCWENHMELYHYLQKPQIYQYGKSIWTDNYISPQMLSAHLDMITDAASYRQERMNKIQCYLFDKLNLKKGMQLIDLGCGPGLYTSYYARQGINVTGLDLSITSISYAKEQAIKEGLDVIYKVGDYRDSFGNNYYNAAICIYEDYGVLSPKDRQSVLKNVYQSLKYGGRFALDIVADAGWDSLKEDTGWYVQEKGFFRPYPHTVLYKRWLYPDDKVYCDSQIVIDHNVTAYHTFQTLFTLKSICDELTNEGFMIEHILGGLDGTVYNENSKQIGIIALKI